jgi:hypothetical protein
MAIHIEEGVHRVLEDAGLLPRPEPVGTAVVG